MKAFLSAVVAAVLMAYGASVVLEQNQRTAEEKFSSSAVRN